MRLALTVASPGAQRTADIVLEADPATPVAHIAAHLDRFMSGYWTASTDPQAAFEAVTGSVPLASVRRAALLIKWRSP